MNSSARFFTHQIMRVLFVCLGNICRSPMAEGIFNHILKQNDLMLKAYCDSAGVAKYHIGNEPDERAIKTCKKHGIVLNHKARVITTSDYHTFDWIVAMDRSVFHEIKRKAPDEHQAKMVLMREYDDKPENYDVPDPYYGTMRNFEMVYDILMVCCTNFVKQYLQPQL